jgi:hypothetical protein
MVLPLVEAPNVDAFSIALESFQQVIDLLAMDINPVLKVAIGFIYINQILADAVLRNSSAKAGF